MRFRKKDLFSHAINLAFFVLTWLFTNSRLFVVGRVLTTEDFFNSSLVKTTSGYNNLYQVVGITFTVLFALYLSKVLHIDNAYEIIKYNRDNFVKHKIKEILISTLLFVFEYIGVQIIFCMVFCKFSVLLDVNFFACMVLLYISLFEHFIIVGMCMLFFQYLLAFKNAYIVFPIILFCLLTIAEYTLGINVSTVYFSEFIGEFVSAGIFDWFSYLIDMLETIVVTAIFGIASRMVFLRRDIIIDEKVES